MRLTTVLLIASLIQVSAAGFAQKISLRKTNAPLKTVLKEITSQSGYDFVVTDDVFNIAKPVNIDLKGVELKAALEAVLKNQSLSYTINKNTITIKAEEPSFLENIIAGFINIDVRGRVVDEKGQSLSGAVVKVKGTDKAVRTNDKGEFYIQNVDDKATLLISYLGYKVKELKVAKDLGYISLEEGTSELKEVDVISTGYQIIAKERVTGAVSKVDNEAFNRRVSTDVLSRIENMSSGLYFAPDGGRRSGRTGIFIHGQSTLPGVTNLEPLIVVDNFPFEGDIRNINPNDVESVSILKDAAAASIWGARAGNGVIVITTKKAKYGQNFKVQANASFNILDKPDIFPYQPLDAKGYIEVEKLLFANGHYDITLASPRRGSVTPVVEILQKQKLGLLSATAANEQINSLENNNVYDDYRSYLYQRALNQQYALNLSGGNQRMANYIGLGFDRNSTSLKENSNRRFSINLTNDYKITNQLQLSTKISFIQSKTTENNNGVLANGPWGTVPPYLRLVNPDGSPAIITADVGNEYKNSFVALGFYNWDYVPLNEIKLADNTLKTTNLLFSSSLKYDILPGFYSEVSIQHENQKSFTRNYESMDTYKVRHLINNFGQYDAATKKITFNFPVGGILNLNNLELFSNNIRGSLNYNNRINNHQITGLLLAEIRETTTEGYPRVSIGYDDEYGSSVSSLNYLAAYPVNVGISSSMSLPGSFSPIGDVGGTTQRFISYLMSASYAFKDKYTFTFSGRRDGSNIFGVKTNQKFKPLWSTGLAWNISKENFYSLNWLPKLNFRASYGYNGNVYNGNAFLTILMQGVSNINNQMAAVIRSAPNANLRWEKVKNINLGLDFGLKNNRVVGALEFYKKEGQDLIEEVYLGPTTGFSSFKGNSAATKIYGFDVDLRSKILDRDFKITNQIYFSYVNEKVEKYSTKQFGTSLITSSLVEGFSLQPAFAYRWGGISSTGDPMGFKGGEKSVDYASIINSATTDSLKYYGSLKPVISGSFNTTFNYKNFGLSFNISYFLKYYFRKPAVSLNAQTLLITNSVANMDYHSRWKMPGDENFVNVPAIRYITNGDRNAFYQYSETNMEKGDHIRLQDISLSYAFRNDRNSKSILNNLQVYGYINNLGILWKATKSNYDPRYIQVAESPKSVAIGIKTSF